ncbi:MAG: nucleoside recognition domain-containing protein [bacterium]|nr:nucleoside recognition domain-containing protein [bacterium]
MVNYIWAFFLIIGIIYSFISGSVQIVGDTLLTSCNTALELVLKLLPVMCLWLGLMNIAKESGLLNKITKIIEPGLRLIFPEIPPSDDSLSFIASNIVMNMVGLGNAATPFGLKAMKELKRLSKNDTASRSMITFLVINTASVTLIPTTVISLRLMYGSSNPTEILGISIIVTIISCFFGLLLDRLCYIMGKIFND